MKPKRPSPLALQKSVNDWNAKHQPGIRVRVKMDDGMVKDTVTRLEASMLGGHTPVIWLEGIPGAYALERVTAV